MAKNIVLLSDGTGNAASNVWRTNVRRIFQALDLTNSKKVAAHDDGVGTSVFEPLALFGGTFGWFANFGSFRTAVVSAAQVETNAQGFVSPRLYDFEKESGVSDHWPVLTDLVTRP